MKLDVHTLAIILCLSAFMQFVVIFIHYRLNRDQSGLGWWVLGSLAFSLGFAANYLRDARMTGHFAIVGNNMLFASGLLLMYVGVLQFFEQKVRFGWIISACTAIMIYFVVFTFVIDNYIARRVFLSFAIAITSLLISRTLFLHRKSSVNASSCFLGFVFLAYGCYFILRALLLITGERGESIFTPTFTQTSMFFVSMIASNLWTFGLIILINQRLNAKQIEDKERLELIYNTSPDAAIVSRLSDGVVVDINDSFTTLTGYTRQEMLGKTTLEYGIWQTPEARSLFIDTLKEKGNVGNIEMQFRRRDGSILTGMISARTFDILGVPHVMSVTRDMTERKRAEDVLRETEAQYRRIVDTAIEGIMYVDRDFIVTFANRQIASMLGYSIDEMIGRNYSSFMAEDQLEDNVAQMKMRAEGKDSVYERCFMTKDGKRHWLLVSAKAVLDSDGRFTASFAMFTDIDARRQIEKALIESEEKYRRIVDTAMEGVISLNRDTRIAFVSRQMASMLGYSPEEMIGKKYESFLPEDQLDANAEQMKMRMQGKDSVYERCFITKDGRRHWILVSAKSVTDEDGNFIGSFAMLMDIDEHKSMEESILMHNRRLQLLLELTQTRETDLQAILDKALEYALQLTSSAIGYIYHYSEEERQFVLNTWSRDVMKECRVVNPQTVYQLDKTGIWGEAVRQRKPIMVNDFQAENPLKKGYPDGHVNLNRYLTVPVFSDGRIVGVIGVGNKAEPYDETDIVQLNLLAESVWSISRQKEDERKIREYAEKLKELNATKDRFFGIIAHDLRSPFNGIIMLSRFLMDRIARFDSETVEYITLINKSAKSAFNLLENLLEWSRIQMGRVEFKPEDIDYETMLCSVFEVAKSQALNKGIAMESVSEIKSVYGDLNMISAILRNLISNAIKFTPRSGKVTVRARMNGAYNEISVTDTGVGISEKVQGRLFRLSEKVTSEGTEGEGGTGLGLLLCREFVDRHHGTIRVESAEGKGSSFIFTLPLKG